MGKSLIIKGADFSINGLTPENLPASVDITSLFILTPQWVAWSTNARADNIAGTKISDAVDITHYINQGYAKIRVTYIAETYVVKGNDNNTSMSSTQNNAVYAPDTSGNTWNSASFIGDIKTAYPYLVAAVKMTDGGGVYTGTTNLSDYIKIELLLP